MSALITIGGMVAGGCFGASYGVMQEYHTDLPGYAFMLYGLFGVIIGGLLGAVVGAVVA